MSLIFWFELLALSFSLILLHRENDRSSRLLIPMMLVTVLVEAAAAGYAMGRASNHIFYNVSVPLIILLFGLMIRSGIESFRVRETGSLILLFFLLFALGNAGFGQGTLRFNSFTYIAGTATLSLLIYFYFSQLVKAPRIITLRSESMFWICSAIILLYIPKTVFYAVFEYLAYRDEVMEGFGQTFGMMNQVLCVIFFSALSYASICRLIFRNST